MPVPSTSLPARVISSPSQTTRSCLACRRRKIRCDKQQPCSYCIKIKSPCTYPDAEDSRPAKRRRTAPTQETRFPEAEDDLATAFRHIRTLESHVHGLETRLNRLDSQRSGNEIRQMQFVAHESGPETNGSIGNIAPARGPGEQLGSNAQSTNEEREVSGAEELTGTANHPNPNAKMNGASNLQRSLMQPPSTDSNHSLVLIPGADASMSELYDTVPEPAIVEKLHNVFTSNVDPVIKLMGSDTSYSVMLDGCEEPMVCSAEKLALLFSILYSAVISLQPDDALFEVIGWSRTEAIKAFQTGFERALAKSNFLVEPRLETSQALTLVLIAGRRELHPTHILGMTSVLITLSRKQGLEWEHDHLEYREVQESDLLWLQIVSLDTWVAEAHSLDPTIIVKENDLAELTKVACQAMVDPLRTPAPRPNESTADILRMRMYVVRIARGVLFSSGFRARCNYPNAEDGLCNDKLDYMETTENRENVWVWFQLRHQYTNLADMEAVGRLAKLMLARMRLAVYIEGHELEGPRDAEEDCQVYTQESINILEKAQQLAKARNAQRWLWLAQQHVEWDAAGILMTCLLQRSIDGDLMERAEVALTDFFDHWKKRISASQKVRWETLQKLRSKLQARRRRALEESSIRSSKTDNNTSDPSAALIGWDDLSYLGQLDFEQTDFWL